MFNADFFKNVMTYSSMVIGAVEVIKTKVKIKGVWTVVVSVVISAVISIPALQNSFINYLAMSACVALASNGLFKFITNAIKKLNG